VVETDFLLQLVPAKAPTRQKKIQTKGKNRRRLLQLNATKKNKYMLPQQQQKKWRIWHWIYLSEYKINGGSGEETSHLDYDRRGVWRMNCLKEKNNELRGFGYVPRN